MRVSMRTLPRRYVWAVILLVVLHLVTGCSYPVSGRHRVGKEYELLKPIYVYTSHYGDRWLVVDQAGRWPNDLVSVEGRFKLTRVRYETFFADAPPRYEVTGVFTTGAEKGSRFEFGRVLGTELSGLQRPDLVRPWPPMDVSRFSAMSVTDHANALRSKDWRVRYHASLATMERPFDADLLRHVLQMMSDPDPDVSSAAIRASVTLARSSPDATTALLDRLVTAPQNEYDVIQQQARYYKHTDEKLTDQFLEMIGDDMRPRVRHLLYMEAVMERLTGKPLQKADRGALSSPE